MRRFKKPTRTPSIEWLRDLLNSSHIHLNKEQLEQLWRYHNLLRSRNQDRDLTRIVGFENTVIKHYVDSMIVGKLMTLPTPLLDLGTGAGFPGIPLKIRYPHLKIVLAEPRPRRAMFLNEAVRTLQLPRVQVFDHKVVSQSFQQPMKGVITRAVEPIEKTILRTSACIDVGSLLIFMKGPSADPEVKEAIHRFKDQYRLVEDKSYTLPDTPHDRRLVIFERFANLGTPESPE